ncbi:hypothetical protein E0Z10_g4864 [Xylaria hypoxylon]|uniref:Uncharacterized protein n=1 Tax=Xylaria hypoxylon TaxID=37992 RepID=A0A4Z0YK58_9PEZI|nr:hypothetical protein E0Z10_g4864 [Xylaria hypoxylon]
MGREALYTARVHLIEPLPSSNTKLRQPQMSPSNLSLYRIIFLMLLRKRTSGLQSDNDVADGVRIDLDAIDFEGQAVIHLAVAGGDVTLVEMLIDRGVDYTKLDACGKSPLEIALAHGHDPLVDMLETRTGVDTSQLQSQKLRHIQQVLAYEKELTLRLIVSGDFASRLHGRTIERKSS